MARSLPHELQVLRLLWTRQEASVSELHGDIPNAPSYSTIRKIVERLESKGAIERVRVDGQAAVYRAAAPRTAVIRHGIRRFLDRDLDAIGLTDAERADTGAAGRERGGKLDALRIRVGTAERTRYSTTAVCDAAPSALSQSPNPQSHAASASVGWRLRSSFTRAGFPCDTPTISRASAGIWVGNSSGIGGSSRIRVAARATCASVTFAGAAIAPTPAMEARVRKRRQAMSSMAPGLTAAVGGS